MWASVALEGDRAGDCATEACLHGSMRADGKEAALKALVEGQAAIPGAGAAQKGLAMPRAMYKAWATAASTVLEIGFEEVHAYKTCMLAPMRKHVSLHWPAVTSAVRCLVPTCITTPPTGAQAGCACPL